MTTHESPWEHCEHTEERITHVVLVHQIGDAPLEGVLLGMEMRPENLVSDPPADVDVFSRLYQVY